MNREPTTSGTFRRRALAGTNAFASLLLAALVVAMLNYLAFRHYRRWDVSPDSRFALSGKTHGVLRGITNRLDVTVFLQPSHEIYNDVRNLLQEYEYACRYIRVQWLDPDRDLALTEELSKRYGVNEPNVIVFDNQGRGIYVAADAMADYDRAPMRQGLPPVRTAFRGEQAFSSALLAITSKNKPVVYFLQGHGEGAPDDPDPRRGFSKIAREMEQDHMEVRTLRLGPQHAIPADCEALIIAGATMDLAASELELLARYLENSGRLMLLLDARRETGLELILEPWGIMIGRDQVLDPTRTLTGRGDLFASSYYEHPITAKMKGITTIFYMPRSIRPIQDNTEQADKPHVATLVASSPEGWAETDLDEANARFDADEDIPGPVPVALAVEKGPVPGIDVQIRPTRLVVFGDSDFASNKGLIGGNISLFMSSMNWLVEREELMDIPPKPVEIRRLLLTRRQQRTLLLLFCALMPGLVALAGLAVWSRRRRN